MILGSFFWTNNNSSINDNIRILLKNKGISYYNTLGGKIFAQILGKYFEVNCQCVDRQQELYQVYTVLEVF